MGPFEKLSVLVAVLVFACCYIQLRVLTGCLRSVDESSPALVAEPVPTVTPPDVRPGRISGSVVDAAGRPLRRFSVMTFRAPTAEEEAIALPAREAGRSPWTETDSVAGAFTISALEPGRYRVRIASPGLLAQTSETVVVPAGGAPAPLVIRLAPPRR